MLVFLLILLGSIVVLAAIFYLADFCSFVFEYCEEDAVRLSFDQFIAFYKSAPNKWILEDDYAKYIWIRPEGSFMYDESEPVLFRSYYSLRKYRRWREKNEEVQMEQERNRKTLSLSKCWARDVDSAYANALKEIRGMMSENESSSKRYEQALKDLVRKYDGTGHPSLWGTDGEEIHFS